MARNNDVREEIPESQVTVAADLYVFDACGNHIRFGDLFELERTIVVFIRHFFCGMCQLYVSQLSTVRAHALEQAGTKVVVIGCGDWQLINNYRELTSVGDNRFFSFYADPTRMVYRALGLDIRSLSRLPNGAPRRSYVTMGAFENLMRSIFRAFKNPLHFGRQGDISQLGGEFILGPKKTCSFAHYMRHTQDHIEVADLYLEAGVTFP